MVKKMVRLALACEYQRKPIRRVEVGEKVLGTNSRQFKAVFEEAQIQLRHTFGMEMVELPAKEKVTVREKRGRLVFISLFETTVLTSTQHKRAKRPSQPPPGSSPLSYPRPLTRPK